MQELVSKFGLDWKLLLAQVINFSILLILLRYFAYGPIIKVLRERREKIEAGLAAADASEKKLVSIKEEERAILLRAEEDAIGVVSEAEDKAVVQAKNILESAEKKSEQVFISGQKRLEEERLKLIEEVNGQAKDLIVRGLTVAIGKMNPDERDSSLVDQALKELRSVKP